MNTEQAVSSIQKLKYRYLLLRLIEISLFSVSSALLVFALAELLSTNFAFNVSLVLVFVIAVVVLMVARYRLYRLNSNFFTSYLNQRFPQLNESADLLLKSPEELSLLQQIQLEKILCQLSQILPDVKLPHRILQSLMVFIVSAGLYFFLSALAPLGENKIKSPVREIGSDKNPSSAYIKSLTITLSPPLYTHLKSFGSNDFNLSLPEGSSVRWLAQLSSEPANVKIFFSGRDSMNFTKERSLEYSFEKKIEESGFYQIQWTHNGKEYRSDFYKIAIIKDLPPKIVVKELNQFTKLKYTDQLSVSVKSEVIDDYGLTDALIIATVSKGSGEGVKFREEKLKFTSPLQISGKKIEGSRILDLKKLGLEPADELYFYIEALDNKAPQFNRTRTETFFIAIQDTATEVTSVDAGLGVDLMPEYFRSQRQIIIDTEKLLRDKKNIPTQQFKSTSNELGYDQKALRLRYGQFLGEEDEAGIGQPAEDENQQEESDPLKNVTHQHDTKNEHNLVEQKGKQHQHADKNESDEKEDPLKQFVHEHDNTEEATFFIQSLKTKLKAAITQMWDAELYLRLYRPEKSLPYQYRALNLLKEISSDSRIFVHRSGFDPPPLKEEKRLTADLSEVKNRSDFFKTQAGEKLVSVRDAINAIEKMIGENTVTVSATNQKTFFRAGQELAELAREQPVVFLKGLSLLKSLSETQSKVSAADLAQLRAILWRALPLQMPSPSQQKANGHTLNQKFLNNLNPNMHE